MKNFDLFLGCFGNGITACNRAVSEDGEYKRIAHIAKCGKITWYVEPRNIPDDAWQKIEKTAAIENKSWERWLSLMDESSAYYALLEDVPTLVFRRVSAMDCPLSDKIEYLKHVHLIRPTW